MNIREKMKKAMIQIEERGRATVAQVSMILKAGTEEMKETALNAMVVSGVVSHAVKSLFKKTIKKNDLVATIATEVSFNHKSKRLTFEDRVDVKKASPVIRLFGFRKAKLACAGGACHRDATLDIISIKIGKQILSAVKRGKPAAFDAVFRMFFSGVRVRYCKNSGIFKFMQPKEKGCRPDEEILVYKFISITASGLRNGTFNFALVSRNGVNCDKRIWALDKLTSGFFSETFFGDKQVTDAESFKALNRLSLGFTDSKKMSEAAKNYIVFKNFAERALTKDKKTLDAIMDGRVFINSGLLKASKGFEGFALNYIEKQVIQCRAEAHGLKAAGQFMSSKKIKSLAKALIKRNTTIAYAVVDGKRVEAKNFDIDQINVIDALFDQNGLKYPSKTSMQLTLMKQAYASDSKLTMVVNMMMMSVDEALFKAAVTKSFKKDIVEKLESTGVKIDFNEAGELINVEFNRDGKKNNEDMFSSFLFKSHPFHTIALMPGVLKSQMSTIVEAIKNRVNLLNPAVDSKYMVVQADIGALLGAPILSCTPGNIEAYCGSFEKDGVKKASGVRNPISSLRSVTTFKFITLKEVIKRVMASDLTNEEKDLVIYCFKSSETYVSIPASHYLMEKHDGMDYDIDSMCFITDKDCVSILSKVREFGTKIADNDKDRYKKLPSEIAIDRWHEDECSSALVLPSDEEKENSSESNIKASGSIYKKTEKTKKMEPLDRLLDIVKKFFRDPNASVGEIANAFYNNALILFALNTYLSDKQKEHIARLFSNAYGCTGDKQYVSPVVVEKDENGFEYITVTKKLCIDVLRAFIDSNGSVESVKLFLNDCCDLNRYPAETAIDAAKNGYRITNFFNHSFVLMAMGSDKTVSAMMEDCKEEFNADYANAANTLGLEPKATNTLEVKTITLDKNESFESVVSIFDATEEEIEDDNVVKAMPELLYETKEELRKWANEAIALVTAVLCDIIESVEAQDLREEASKVLAESDRNGINIVSLVKSIGFLVRTEDLAVKQEVDFDGQSSVLWHKEKGLVRVANTIAVAFKQDKTLLTDEEIGGSFIGAMNEGFEIMDGNYGRTSLKALEAFSKYVLAYYKSIGLDVNAYEKITISERGYRLSELNGMECIITSGHAYCDNGAILTLDNHKSNAGYGVIDDGYVRLVRNSVSLDPAEGIYTYGKAAKEVCVNLDKTNAVMGDSANVKYVTNERLNVAMLVNGVKVSKSMVVSGLVYINPLNNVCYRLSADRKFKDKTTSHMSLMNSSILTSLKDATFRGFVSTTDEGENFNLIVRVDGPRISSAIIGAMNNQEVELEVKNESNFFDMDFVDSIDAVKPSTVVPFPTPVASPVAGLAEVALDVTEEAGPATIGSVNDFCF